MILTVIGGAYFLGKENGITKFDEKKIEMSDRIKRLETELQLKGDSIKKVSEMLQFAKLYEKEFYKLKAELRKEFDKKMDSISK